MAFAKITRPTSVSTLIRPRLFRLLEGGKQKPVTWVWASPGAGKTTLVASYLAARKLRTLWYQIDDGDNDIATFFYYLGQAAPKRKRSLPLFTPEYQMGLPVFSRNLFRELFNRLKTPFALVFDNYQEVPADSQLHEVMQIAVAEILQGGRVIFISRSEPPAPFAPVRVKQLMEIVDWPQLRFTQTEVNGLIRKLAPGRWSKNTVNTVHSLSDGWAAGVVLSFDQLRNQSEAPENPKPLSSQVLFDYFAGEIFKKADPAIREVLLQTAFVPKVSASIAEKLTGQLQAAQILSNLYKQNYFTSKLGESEATYQYHPLFREFLLSQAHKTYSPARVTEIRRSAATLVESAGQIEAAPALLRDAEDWEGLAQLICRHAGMLLAQGRGRTLEQWLEAIPETMFAENPWLLYWRGMCRLGYRYEDCRRDCEQALAAFRRRGEPCGTFLTWAALIACCQMGGDARAMDPWIELFDELMREITKFPSEEVETRVAIAMSTAITMRQPNHPDGAHWAERSLRLARKQTDAALKATTLVNWLVYYWELGDIPKAGHVVDEMRALARANNVSPIAALTAAFGLAWHEALLALPSYRTTASYTLDLAQKCGFEPGKYGALNTGLIGALSDGDLETAGPWLQESVKHLNVAHPGYSFFSHWMVVWEALIRGDILRAASYQPEMLRIGIRDGWPVHNAVANLLSVHVLHAQNKTKEAQARLDDALEIARTMRSSYIEFMARLTEAHFYLDSGQESDGVAALSKSMALGRAGGFVNSLVWQPAIMAKLCARALEAGIEVAYVQDLVRKRKLIPKETPIEIETWPWPVKIYALGRFEIVKDDQLLQSKGKVQRKPLALLKAIIAFGARGVREESLIDALWPDAEGDAAARALTSAIHRLRRLLAHEEAIMRKDNELGLDERYCWVDVAAVERLLERADSALRNGSDEHVWSEALKLIQKAAELYKGPFLGGDADAPWAIPLNDRLRRRLLRQLIRLGQHWEAREDLHQAISVYEEGLRIDPCAEDVCRRLMTTYHAVGRPSEILAAYQQCRDALAAKLGTTPSVGTDSLMSELRAR
jgi:LuxR family transcriptional regulator, maltose regulon positive regulatory protein